MYKKMEGFAIVTGGARGLGAAMVKQLAKEGYDVVINHVSASSGEKAKALAEEVKAEYGVGAIVVQADVSDYENCKKMIEAGVEAFGEKIAVLVNNAGITNAIRFDQNTPENYERLIRIELLGSMHCTHCALPYMEKAKDGCIIFITSVAGLMGVAGQVEYSAAKAGMHGMMRALTQEVSEFGIRINCIAPGAIATEIFNVFPQEALDGIAASIPLKRFGQPEEIAECMSYVVNARYLQGQIISPNGGNCQY